MSRDEAAVSDRDYEYDVAISYASEDALQAEALATVLHNRGVRVFYDKYEKAVLWGKDLYISLSDLYQNRSRYCILIVSKHYVTKLWTKHELQSAQARALREQDAYILPIRLDDTQIPGILPTIAYLNWFQETPETIADLLVEKLKGVSQNYATFAKRLSQEIILNFINEATTQVVLILGRFTPERKIVLDAIRNELSIYNYIPILFDFEQPKHRDFTETVRTLAHLSRFIIADLTDPRTIPFELQIIVPTVAIPVQPILLEGKKEFAMFNDLQIYHWVLPVYYYKDQADLLKHLKEDIIVPAEQKVQELEKLWRHQGLSESTKEKSI